MTRSSKPRYLQQVVPGAGEDGVWIREVTECTSLRTGPKQVYRELSRDG
jgi:hypothetical protein